jgi:hypothetical protein
MLHIYLFTYEVTIFILKIVIIGASMQTTLKWGNFQLDGIGLPTYAAILLYQLLRGWDSIRSIYRRLRKQDDTKINSEERAE